ncbi:hypothetical protein Avbf_12922 [Armadillidium vulgare]|nr:hypothetical protein Avbf_12922 [Armadillidium vulgare]
MSTMNKANVSQLGKNPLNYLLSLANIFSVKVAHVFLGVILYNKYFLNIDNHVYVTLFLSFIFVVLLKLRKKFK